MNEKKRHIHPHKNQIVSRKHKEQILNQKGKVFWFTGLSGSGKSTLAMKIEKMLIEEGHLCQILDGDNVRSGINKDLGFSLDDRKENIRRVAEMAKVFCESGFVVLACLISPTNEIRNCAKKIIGEEDFSLVYLKSSVETCEARDVKGLYKKARNKEILDFSGIDSVFDIPESPDLILDTENEEIDMSLATLRDFIKDKIQYHV